MPKAKSGQLNGKKKKTKKSRAQDSAKQYAPVAMASKRRNKPATITNRVGGIRVQHTEYVADIPGSVLFATTGYAVNPGMARLFPWLSGLARRYESYVFHKLKFELRAQSATSATGTILLAMDFDASDAAPLTKQEALSYVYSERGAPWQDIHMPLDGVVLHKLPSNYVRSAPNPAGTDVKMYDIGNLFVGTQGQAGATMVSELYVSYDIELTTPQLNQDSGSSAQITGTAGLAAASLFGTDAVIDVQSSFPFTVDATGSTLTFQAGGTLLVGFTLVGTVLVSGVALGNTGTCAIALAGACNINSTQLRGCGYQALTVAAGQTWTPTITSATTLTAGRFYMSVIDPAVLT